MHTNKGRLIATVILFFCTNCFVQKTSAQSKPELRKLTLKEIDTVTMHPDYYLFTFKGKTGRYQLLSRKNVTPKVGCWEKLTTNNKYTICVTAEGSYYSGNVLIVVGSRGLVCKLDDGSNKTVLKKEEYFYLSEDINGLFTRCSGCSGGHPER